MSAAKRRGTLLEGRAVSFSTPGGFFGGSRGWLGFGGIGEGEGGIERSGSAEKEKEKGERKDNE